MTTTKQPLVVVEWNDAWVNADEPVALADVRTSHKPTVVTTIGWLLLEDDIGVSIANEYYEGTYRGRSFIMRSMVRSVTPYVLTRPRRRAATPATDPGLPPKT